MGQGRNNIPGSKAANLNLLFTAPLGRLSKKKLTGAWGGLGAVRQELIIRGLRRVKFSIFKQSSK